MRSHLASSHRTTRSRWFGERKSPTKTVYSRPKRTIIAGHWTGEEQGEVGSKAFTEDHPEVIKGLQVLFNQDNGTGRILRLGGAGLPNAAEHISRWLGQLPASFKEQLD